MALMVAQVRAAVAQVLTTALGTTTQVATAPDQLTPPCLLIGMPTIEYHSAFARGLDQMELPIFGILPRVHDQAAVDRADAWVAGAGASSVLTILEADPTLGGACQALAVKLAVAELYPTGSGDLPCYNWTVEVYG